MAERERWKTHRWRILIATLVIENTWLRWQAVVKRETTFAALPWFGPMPAVDDRIRKLTTRYDDAQARLDERLLDDAERERLAAERAARNAMPQRKTRADGSQYDKYPDGRVVEVPA
jgi:hypothetical protein